MTVSDFIKVRLAELNMTQSELANKLDITKQNFSNKLKRDNFSSIELFNILKVLHTDFVLETSTNKYKIEY